ncbi:hypothetical protein B0G76_2881 [Paraburkholderia sp. BL23I1N1]|uniref:hypothetical protein n=1 Tax=Paraburkholderia sp. BL23I1N1 TaxID=1938802 RepID=UPI000FF36E99|nr:hypothetical protein [Paraburkholderia sp. BL23I1N1]RKE36679.1 hypothetical protein B0G76_2881 [Paraburkholderia sp. BL23I1N1]
MPRTPMTDEERAAKQRARVEAKRAAREARKTELRMQIELRASKIPPHIAQGGVQTVRNWKDALDKATSTADLSRVSVERLDEVLETLKRHTE